MSGLEFTAPDYWRAIILYGLNTATYKIALGQCLAGFVERDQTEVTMGELAEAFFDLYAARLTDPKPQLATPGRLTVMERVVELHRIGKLTREQAITRVADEAFGDVLPRFHTVGQRALPNFYEQTAGCLVLTDAVFDVFTGPESAGHLAELDSRWSLLEAAFAMRRDNSVLANDVRALYLQRGYERTDITGTIPVLNAYQHGACFYCGEPIAAGDAHVDHVIPRQFIYHDEIWNLVLAHRFCNEQKSDLLPERKYIAKLAVRNEYYISSNHPIRDTLIRQLGTTADARRAHVEAAYRDAAVAIPLTWQGVRGYDPELDQHFKDFLKLVRR